ncbi:hypothetical protein [Pontibacter arcticus]|uniref:Uncharacterized protein n=1 Tax=Pontibacter arcticus TaxID=2080288 RepID=A0A364RC90_9BACT|nr:hypothetical protein [Pontibacter arcticus]RAU81941.1 hypothetical protein DP923_14750 [Pontibacter arcticus]
MLNRKRPLQVTNGLEFVVTAVPQQTYANAGLYLRIVSIGYFEKKDLPLPCNSAICATILTKHTRFRSLHFPFRVCSSLAPRLSQ